MANYRNISTDFWTDPKVDDEFTPEDKYFYLYLLTNPHTNICGCYEVGRKQMERETGYNWDTIQRLLGRFEMFGVAKYNDQTKEILLLNWKKYNWHRSEKVKIAVLTVASHIKAEEFRDYIFRSVEEHIPSITDIQKTELQNTESQITDTDVSIGYGYRMDNVSDKPIKPKKNAFHNFPERKYDPNLEKMIINQ